MHNPELTVATAIFAVLVLLPVPTQLRVRNIPVLALLGGTFSVNVIFLVNTFVWAGNVRDVAPVWCDITTSIVIYFPFMAGGAALCICRQLEWICSARSAASARPRRILFEISLCFIIPLISIPIMYSVSSSRYMIMENLGCLPNAYPSKFMLALLFGPQLLVTSVSCYFCCLAIRNIIHRRRSTFSNAQSSLTTSRFIRLLSVCIIVGVWPLIAVLLSIYLLSFNLFPWPGWAALHAHFSSIPRIPLLAQLPALRQMLSSFIWLDITSSYLVFITLICTEDVRRDLSRAWLFVIHLANSFWQRCIAALAWRPRTLTPAPSSKWFDDSSSIISSNGNERKILVSGPGGDGVILPTMKKAYTIPRHDRYPSAEGDFLPLRSIEH